MMKHIFIALLFMLMSFSGLAMKKAGASEFNQSFVTHEKFLQMSEKEQQQIVIKLMEFMSSAEATSKIQEIVSHGTPEEKAKWSRVIQFISNLVMSEAYASDFDRYNKIFKDARKNVANSSRCIYAGWISQTTYNPSTKKTYCNHPANVTVKKNGKIVNPTGYPSVDSCPVARDKKGRGTKILCNPSLYGFDTGAIPFCADASPKMHNSSMQCMSLALSGDSAAVENRLKLIAENLAKDETLFQEMMEFVFFNCACPSKMGSSKADSDYREYMRPHRTCYGLLNQMRSVLARNECAPLEDEPNFKVIVNFLDQLQDQIITSKITDGANECQKNADKKKSICDDKKDEKDACLTKVEAERKNCLMVDKAQTLVKKEETGKKRNIEFDGQYGAIINSIYKGDKDTQNFCANYASGKPSTPVVKPDVPAGGDGDDGNQEAKSCEVKCVVKAEEAQPATGTSTSTSTSTSSTAPVGPNKPVTSEDPAKDKKVKKPKEVIYSCEKIIETTKDGQSKKDVTAKFEVKTKADIKEENLKHEALTCSVSGIPDAPVEDTDPEGGDEGDKVTAELKINTTTDKTTLTVAVLDKDNKEVTDVTYKWYKEGDAGKASVGTGVSLEKPRDKEAQKYCVDIENKETESKREISPKTICGEVPAREEVKQPTPPAGPQQPGMQRMPRQQNIHINWGVR